MNTYKIAFGGTLEQKIDAVIEPFQSKAGFRSNL